ncbi:MAG: prepilin peptidase [Candidatus Omnitrophota bacterium]
MPILILFLLGAAVGSFLNVCMIRIPMRESIAFPASHCLSCRRPIAWFDNIPIVSFFALKGRCRNCGSRISWQYPAIEALTGFSFVLFFGVFGLTAKGILYLVLSLALLVVSVIDWKTQIIPDVISLPGLALGLAASIIFPGLHGAESWKGGLIQSAAGAFVGGGILALIGTLAERILKKEAMGGGDVKLLAMIGAFIGWRGILWTLFAGSFAGALIGMYLRVRKGEERIPFGPFLAFAAVSYLFFGERVWQWYLNTIGLTGA